MVAARHARTPFAARLVVLGDRELLSARAQRVGLARAVRGLRSGSARRVWRSRGVAHPLAVPAIPGRPDLANATAVLDMLERGADACATGGLDALVTAPVQKSTLLDAGIAFTGHTEFFAERTHTPRVVMMLVGGSDDAVLRVAVTTHLPLAAVPAAISRAAVQDTVRRRRIAAQPVRHRAAAHRRVRTQSARRRRRASRPRGRGHDRAGHRLLRDRRHRRDRAAARGHRVRAAAR